MNLKRVFIVGSNGKYGYSTEQYMYELFKNNSIEVGGYYSVGLEENSTQILANILLENNVNTTVFIVAEQSYNALIFETLKKNDIDFEHGYNVVSFTLDDIQAYTIGYNIVFNLILDKWIFLCWSLL